MGDGACLEHAFVSWSRAYPQENVQRIELTLRDDYSFDLAVLDALDPSEGVMLVAYDERFGNFKRMELMQIAIERKFKLESFVSPTAVVAPGVVIGPNAFIGEGAVIGVGSRVEFNAVVRDGVRVGSGVRLRPSCWLEAGVIVGDGADIGAHAILRGGAVVGSRVKIGRYCELGWVRLYDKDVAARTVFDNRYEEPIRVYGD